MNLSDRICYICSKGFNGLTGYVLDLQLDQADDKEIPCLIRHITCNKKDNDEPNKRY